MLTCSVSMFIQPTLLLASLSPKTSAGCSAPAIAVAQYVTTFANWYTLPLPEWRSTDIHLPFCVSRRRWGMPAACLKEKTESWYLTVWTTTGTGTQWYCWKLALILIWKLWINMTSNNRAVKILSHLTDIWSNVQPKRSHWIPNALGSSITKEFIH